MRHWPDPAPGRQPYTPEKMAHDGLCVGCGACAKRMRWDRNGFLKPHHETPVPESFASQCPFSPLARNEDEISAERFGEAPVVDRRIGRLEAAYVGHVSEAEFRRNASSGGLTSWVAAELLRTGTVDGVAHVAPTDPATGRHFAYRVSRSVDELNSGAKSRYYPVELSQILAEIRERPGRYAIIGVPCFIKAMHLLRRVDPLIRERVTHTLGLFCGHMKSAAMIESFAWQLGTELSQVQAIDYRMKDEMRPAKWYRAHLDLAGGGSAEQDWWHLADGDWGAGFLQNPACDWCDDVVGETADISFGDAWVEPFSSDGRGTNIVVVRTRALNDMIEQARGEGRLALEPVDAEFVVRTQAAGLRHRRDGLAYRLSWRRGIMPRKRVKPSRALPLRRKLVYRLRHSITRMSHPMLRLARFLRIPAIYTLWARSMLRLYQSVTWSRGRLGGALDCLLPQPEA